MGFISQHYQNMYFNGDLSILKTLLHCQTQNTITMIKPVGYVNSLHDFKSDVNFGVFLSFSFFTSILKPYRNKYKKQ